jgi:hypothetical protein
MGSTIRWVAITKDKTFNALPGEYKAILAAERRQNAGVITIDDAEDCPEECYRQVYCETNNNKVANSSDPEMTFTVVTGKKCWSCGSSDHLKSECPKHKPKDKTKNSSNNSNKVQCGRCGKPGHATESCWKDPKNADKRPQWLKNKINKSAEVANVTFTSPNSHAGGTCEFLFSSVTQSKDHQQFPNNMALLENPDIWIADTGATVHITSNEDGIDDAAACDVAVRVGNGKIAESTFKGSLRVDACDRTGTVTGRGVLSKVHVVPEAPYNLCSIFQCMEHGWTLGGTKEADIWLEKDSFTLRFDIRLDTLEGVVWCACLRR